MERPLSEKAKQSVMEYGTPANAKDLVRLHNIVYNGYYPYHEMLDENYLSNMMSSRKKCKVGLFRTKNSKIYCGSAITEINLKKKASYFRGFLMDPAYRGKIDIKNLLSNEMFNIYNDYDGLVNKAYTECRTTHTIAQFMMCYFGLTPVAIFPSKDLFLGPESKRESEVLMVAHYDECFINREMYHALLPEFSKLYEHMKNTFNFESDPDFFNIDYGFTDIEVSKAYSIYSEISEFKTEGEFNRFNYEFYTETGSKLSFNVTKTVDSAENAEFTAVEPVEIMALMMKLEEVIERDGIKYFEIYMPAINPENQRLMLEMGFNVFGYVPAWHENHRGQNEDCLIFGLVVEKVKKRDIKLIGSGSTLLRRLKPFMGNAIK